MVEWVTPHVGWAHHKNERVHRGRQEFSRDLSGQARPQPVVRTGTGTGPGGPREPAIGYGPVMAGSAAAAAEELNSEVVRRYLRVFETRDVAELENLVDENVLVHGAGYHVQGRHYPEGSVLTPGLSDCRVRIDDLFAAADRVTVAFTMTYTHDRSGRDLTMTGLKCYRLHDGRIVEFWGETDLYGLLRQAGLVPEQIPSF